MNLKDEQGIAAIGTAVMLIVVLSLFGTALWQFSMFEMRQVTRNENELKALYLAQAGAEAAMAAWLDKPINQKPDGKLSRVYYNKQTGEFQLTEPASSYGYFDAVITYIDDQNHEKHDLTEITVTATVGNTSKTVTVTTYPFMYGQDKHLKWYDANSGAISKNSNEQFQEGLVRVEASRPIHFSGGGNRTVKFSGKIIQFEQEVDLSHDMSPYPSIRTLEKLDALVLPTSELNIEAETVFFGDVTLLYSIFYEPILWIPSRQIDIKSSIFLKLPNEKGVKGKDLDEQLLMNYNIIIDPEARYGRVYFDGAKVNKVEKSKRLFQAWKERSTIEITIEGYPDLKLAGNAFYFKDGTDLSNLKAGDLIPIKDDSSRRSALRDIKPFIWEQRWFNVSR